MIEMIKEWFAREKEKTSEMNRQEKVSYIFEYYKFWLLGIVAFLVAVCWLIYHFCFAENEQGFNCAVVNCATENDVNGISDDLTAYFGYNTKKETAYFDMDYQIAYPGVENTAADDSFFEKFFLNLRMGVLDVAIMPESYMEYCNSVGHPFYDVTDVLTQEQLNQYEDRFLKGKDDEGEEYICGININDMQFFKQMGIAEVEVNEKEPLVLTFPYGGKHLEESSRFLDYLELFE